MTIGIAISRSMDLSSGRPGVLISRRNARQFNVKLNRPIYLRFGNKEIKTIVAGFIDIGDVNSKNPADGVILTDIATAQEILELGDDITRIDLLLHKDDIDKVRQILPKGVFLVETNKRNQVVRGLSRSFETSLTAFSMLALFMGIFLIYNTISFSVARRRHINGTLKSPWRKWPADFSNGDSGGVLVFPCRIHSWGPAWHRTWQRNG